MTKTFTKFQQNKKADIKANYKATDKEKAIQQHVYRRKWQMDNSELRQKQVKIWDKAEKQYESLREEREKDEWQSNHVVPLTISVVETALAESVDQRIRPLILPRGLEDEPGARIMTNIWEYTWDMANGDSEYYNIKKDKLIYGTSIAQEFYWQDQRIIKFLNKAGKEEEKDVTDFEGCYLKCKKLRDFWIDEKARSFDGPYQARDCVDRTIMDIDDFRMAFRGEIWDPYNNARFVKPGGDLNYYEYYQPPHGIDTSRDVEVLWYWSKRPDDALYIVANDVPVVYGPNPYNHKQLPFVRAVDIKRPHEFYGKGEAELLESTQDELNTIRRMHLDRNHLDIQKMFLVSNRVSLNDDDLISRPHALIPMDDPDSVKPVEYGDVPRSIQIGKEWLTEDALQATGIDPRLEGIPTPGTATEAAIVKESALKKIRLKLALDEWEFAVRHTNLRVHNIIQFYSEPKLKKIVGEKGTMEYENEIAQLRQKGLLVEENGGFFKKEYLNVRLDGKEIGIDDGGKYFEKGTKGYTFFTATPDSFVPKHELGYDIKVSASPSLPPSRALMQSKAMEMYDRLIQLAIAGVGYDPVKLGDQLLKVNDYNPEDFHTDQEGAVDEQQGRQQQLIDLATTENQLLLKGEKVPPTPNASPAHTQIHIAMVDSDLFRNLPDDDPKIANILQHIIGEMFAQTGRGGVPPEGIGEEEPMGGEMPMGELPARPQTQVSPRAGGGNNNALKDAMPNLMQGGAEVPR